MAQVIHLTHRLSQRPTPEPVAGVNLRHFRGPEDIEPWLELRHRAFARLRVGVRQWSEADFEAELLAKPWWQPRRMWLAEPQKSARNLFSGGGLVGTITMALRGEVASAKPVVHWLAVDPAWRRRGIGQLLVETLEAAAWDDGYRQVWLETHQAWAAAGQLYARLGYEPT